MRHLLKRIQLVDTKRPALAPKVRKFIVDINTIEAFFSMADIHNHLAFVVDDYPSAHIIHKYQQVIEPADATTYNPVFDMNPVGKSHFSICWKPLTRKIED
jgi:hypothetical protein